jgi:uncharacterized membrane protein
MKAESPPEQLGVALFWLAVFFLIYLVLPILHGLVRRVKSAVQDMVLVLVNAAVVFYYLWTLLHEYRGALALCSLGLGAAHLLLAGVVLVRCREDLALRRCLLVAALVFATLAVPLYFRMYAVAILWAVEGLLLTAAGLRYRSALTQLAGGLALALALGDLLTELPMHTASFRLFFNPAFGTWCFVAAAVMVCHVLYRLDKHVDANLRSIGSQGFYVAGLGLLMAVVTMELWCHAALNTSAGKNGAFFWQQMVLVFAAFILLFVARPICPRGQAARVVGTMLAGAGAVYTLVTLPTVHERTFTVFVNGDFARAILLVAVLFASAWLLRRSERREPDEFVAAAIVATGAIIVLWILLTEEIWLYYDRLRPSARWDFLARMYIAMLWAAYATALMVVGFWRQVRLLRYLAVGILALAVGDLLTALPMHVQSFSPVFNAAFGAWCCVAAAMIAGHVLYRLDNRLDPHWRLMNTQGYYVAGLGLLMAAITMELWCHQELNMSPAEAGPFFWKQMTLVFAAFILLFVTRPICPRGEACKVMWTLLAVAAPVYLLTTLPSIHGSSFTMFLNADFARALLLVAVLFASARLSRRTERREPDQFLAAGPVALGLIVLLWLLLTEEIWLYYDRLRPSQWRFLMQMYISVLWAVYATVLMVIGFWRRVRALRYIALGIFVLLLAKIFLVDTRELETAYRIAGFLATGLALVAVSYLYQYLKKTGFFETVHKEHDPADRERHDA